MFHPPSSSCARRRRTVRSVAIVYDRSFHKSAALPMPICGGTAALFSTIVALFCIVSPPVLFSYNSRDNWVNHARLNHVVCAMVTESMGRQPSDIASSFDYIAVPIEYWCTLSLSGVHAEA